MTSEIPHIKRTKVYYSAVWISTLITSMEVFHYLPVRVSYLYSIEF